MTDKASKAPKPRGRPFGKGNPGRPAGATNKATRAVQELARELTTGNQAYMKNLKSRLESGKCAPAVEVLLFHYAHGRPPDELRLGDSDGGPLGPITFVIRGREERTK